MRVITLASGSKGNCTLVETDKLKVLIDAGLGIRELEKRLIGAGVHPRDINAIFITHEHSDHIKGITAFSKKYNTKVIANIKEWNILESKLEGLSDKNKIYFENNNFKIADLEVDAFSLSHDSASCYGYSFLSGGLKTSIATDLGFCPQSIVEKLKGSKLLILEANHDINLLNNNPNYPIYLKKRILSNKGHLNNIATSEVIKNLVGGQLEQVVLAHLSEENNTPSLAYNTVKGELLKDGIIEGKHLFIDVASQHQIGNNFKLKK